MPYQSSEKTRQKKDAKRAAMMQAAVKTFAEKGYQAATIRDIVQEADVSVGTFYFYFPDKETLFIHLFDETADFLLKTLQQAANSRVSFPEQIRAALKAYVSIAIYEPAVVQLLLIAGVGAIPTLDDKRTAFRESMVLLWEKPVKTALEKNMLAAQNPRLTAVALSGAIDAAILNLIARAERAEEAPSFIRELSRFVLRAAAYLGDPGE
ncbi:MAG: TetR/AcrR family transcriptional regulator [Candidatus Promineifilaceae bacterium]